MHITGKTLKKVRGDLGESQTTFAERFGVDQATVSRWETEGPPDRGVAAKLIARVLDDLAVEARA
jgi:DNA-binding transcriptional regulator YiaG